MLMRNEALLMSVTVRGVGLWVGMVGVVGMLVVVKPSVMMGVRVGVRVLCKVGLLWLLRSLLREERLFWHPVNVLLNY